MGGLLKFIIITICVLYILRVLARIFLPFLFKKAIHKMQEKMQQQQGGAYQQQTKPEGKITVDYIPPQKKEPKLDNAGDFVDYEEVK
ncbi:hypothetical protein PBAC_06850 [Pedobacter glucosidilyticus]|uniref:DUF4834 family protein n=1 Tax=Pedobacter aquae TaxID=2605747 RepID=A0A5C0VJI5_9SPHI|nr:MULTISPECIES: DUF4834 family protein [Pedobacter]KHJ39085.1 hypothetical protein PBAC_06850 [Pedobacter glucosidilyticus]QEK52247.1 DUF4834 family protein [Pedobacter aquae]